MRVLIAHNGAIPVFKYGGTERVIWYLGRELTRMGHEVTYLVPPGSHCDFAGVRILEEGRTLPEQVPADTDVAHLFVFPDAPMGVPYITTLSGNIFENVDLDPNTVFISRSHARTYGSETFVYNGLDWDDYGPPVLGEPRDYFHFLGNAAWRLKNVKGAINAIKRTRGQRLKVLGGQRFNVNMGVRFTFTRRATFHGMVGGDEKNELVRHSRGLVFPVRWHEPFGLAITESLYLGCPVFGTPYGSLPELVPSDVGCLTDSEAEMAAALDDYRSFSRRRCHEYARDQFNARVMAEGYLRLYERVAGGEILHPTPPRYTGKPRRELLPWTA